MAENTPSSYPLPPMQAAPPVSPWWLAISRQTPAFLLPIGTAFLFLLGWQVIAVYGKISPAILPPPTMILEQLRDNFPLIMSHSYPTTIETLVAFLISIPLGIALAALLVYSTLAQQALYPNIIFFQLIPKIALAPLFIVWLGIRSFGAHHFFRLHLFLPNIDSDRCRASRGRNQHAETLPFPSHVRMADSYSGPLFQPPRRTFSAA